MGEQPRDRSGQESVLTDAPRDDRDRPVLDVSLWRRWAAPFAGVLTAAAAVVAIAVPGTGLGWTWAALIVSVAAGVGAAVVLPTTSHEADRSAARRVLAVAIAGVLISLAALDPRAGWMQDISQPPVLWWVLVGWGLLMLSAVGALVRRRPTVDRATFGHALLNTAIAAAVLCVGVAGDIGVVSPMGNRAADTTDASTDSGLPPPGYQDKGCTYSVTNDSHLGAAPHMILPGGRVEQHFQAVTPFLWTFGAVMGYQGGGARPTVEYTLLDGSTPLYRSSPPVDNNVTTEVRLRTALPVQEGHDYVFVVTNTSNRRLGFYMYADKDANGTLTKPPNTGPTFVHAEERQPDGLRTQALSGCIGGMTKDGQ